MSNEDKQSVVMNRQTAEAVAQVTQDGNARLEIESSLQASSDNPVTLSLSQGVVDSLLDDLRARLSGTTTNQVLADARDVIEAALATPPPPAPEPQVEAAQSDVEMPAEHNEW